MTTARIEDYALLGDLRTAVPVHRDAASTGCCLSRFDSPACFAALLSDENAGMWRIAPQTPNAVSHRRYPGDSLVLETEWRTDDGTVEVIDFLPPRGEALDVRPRRPASATRIDPGLARRLRWQQPGCASETPPPTKSSSTCGAGSSTACT